MAELTQSAADIKQLEHKMLNSIELPAGGLKGNLAAVANVSAVAVMTLAFLTAMYWMREDCKAVNEAYRAEIETGRVRADKVDDRNREDAKERWKALGDHTKAISAMTADVKIMSAAVNKVADKVGVIVGEIPRAPESKPKIAEGASLNGPLPKSKDEGGQ